MMHKLFSSTFDFACPSELKMIRAAQEAVGKLFQEKGVDGVKPLYEGYPECPKEPGIFALIAPDGVMVRAITSETTALEMRELVRDDATLRLMLDRQKQDLLNGKSYEQVMEEGIPEFIRLKQLYKVERLGDSKTEESEQ